MSDRLFIPEGNAEDLAWMREQIRELKLSEVTDHHLEKFLDLAEGNREMAVKAIASIHAGKPYEPMRALRDRLR